MNIGVTGANDASLFLSSTGTGADAVRINATAGGIDILASGAAAGEDIDIVATGSSVNISSSESDSDAVRINATDAAGEGGLGACVGELSHERWRQLHRMSEYDGAYTRLD